MKAINFNHTISVAHAIISTARYPLEDIMFSGIISDNLDQQIADIFFEPLYKKIVLQLKSPFYIPFQSRTDI